MKVLALSDIHGDQAFCLKMAAQAKEQNIDLVVMAGDLSDDDGFIRGIVGPFVAQGLEVAVLPGNHEPMSEIAFLVEQYGVIDLHGKSFMKKGVAFFGCGYGNVGLCQMSAQDTHSYLVKAHEDVALVAQRVMVTHTHPANSIFGLGMFPGCPGISQALEELQPNIHICGHIHETQGMEEIIGSTRVINAGKVGKIIEF